MRWTLLCDGEGSEPCRTKVEGRVGEDVRDLRATAADEGWKVSRFGGNGFDFCPGCVGKQRGELNDGVE